MKCNACIAWAAPTEEKHTEASARECEVSGNLCETNCAYENWANTNVEFEMLTISDWIIWDQ